MTGHITIHGAEWHAGFEAGRAEGREEGRREMWAEFHAAGLIHDDEGGSDG